MFETIFKILNYKKATKEEVSKVSEFLMLRFIGSNPKTINFCNIINRLKMPIVASYFALKSNFENSKIYCKMPKKYKSNEVNIKNIQRYYNLNQKDAEEYLEVISKDELNKINKMYKDI